MPIRGDNKLEIVFKRCKISYQDLKRILRKYDNLNNSLRRITNIAKVKPNAFHQREAELQKD